MGVNSLPKTVTRQRRDCDLNPGPSAPESSTLTNRLPSHPAMCTYLKMSVLVLVQQGRGMRWPRRCWPLLSHFKYMPDGTDSPPTLRGRSKRPKNKSDAADGRNSDRSACGWSAWVAECGCIRGNSFHTPTERGVLRLLGKSKNPHTATSQA